MLIWKVHYSEYKYGLHDLKQNWTNCVTKNYADRPHRTDATKCIISLASRSIKINSEYKYGLYDLKQNWTNWVTKNYTNRALSINDRCQSMPINTNKVSAKPCHIVPWNMLRSWPYSWPVRPLQPVQHRRRWFFSDNTVATPSIKIQSDLPL